jgi:hypothetical protein
MHFVMEMQELHCGNAGINFKYTDNSVDMFAMVLCSLKETGAITPPAHAGHDRRNVQNKDKC